MGRKTPPFSEYPAWTEARFWSFVRAALRKAYTRWPPKFEVLRSARRNKPPNKAGRHRYEYKCAKCKKWFQQKNVEVDHITPCGSLKSWDDVGTFARRLFVGAEGLRLLCKPCHVRITKEERDAKKK